MVGYSLHATGGYQTESPTPPDFTRASIPANLDRTDIESEDDVRNVPSYTDNPFTNSTGREGSCERNPVQDTSLAGDRPVRMRRPPAHLPYYLSRTVTLVGSSVETLSRMSERPRPVSISDIGYRCSQSKRRLKWLTLLCRHLTQQHLLSPTVQLSEFIGGSGDGDAPYDLGDTVASDGRDRSDSKERGEPEVSSGSGGVGEATARAGGTAQPEGRSCEVSNECATQKVIFGASGSDDSGRGIGDTDAND